VEGEERKKSAERDRQDEKKNVQEQRLLEGTWKAVSIESNGRRMEAKGNHRPPLEFTGNMLKIIIGDQGASLARRANVLYFPAGVILS
jgi:hypothetical protein